MCGIVAVVRRPSDRVAPELTLLVAALDAAEVSLRPYVTAARTRPGSSAAAQRIAAIERALRGTADRSRCSPIPVALSALEHRAASLTNIVVDLDAALDAYDSGIEIEALNAAVVERQGRAVGAEPRPLAHGARRRASRQRRARAACARGVPLRAGRAVGARPARGARPRLRRPARPRHRPRSRSRRTRRSRASSRRVATIRSSRRARCASPTGTSRSCTRPRPRSVSSATTPRACARRSRADELLRLALRADTAEAVVLAHTRWASVGIISEANAHPLNQEELGGDR